MICFDHAAAAPLLPQLRNSMAEIYEQFAGNPEAAHSTGYNLRKEVSRIGEELFKILLPNALHGKRAVFYAPDATSLINAVGILLADKSAAVAGSALDHAATRAMQRRCFGKYLEIKLTSGGRMIPGTLADAPAARLITLNHVQSEIGVRQDLAELMPQLRSAAPEAVILLDAVQSAAYYAYPEHTVYPDLLLISGEKLGAPGGAALLACGSRCKFFSDGFERLRKVEHQISKVCVPQAFLLLEALKIAVARRQDAGKNLAEINRFLRNKLHDRLMPNGRKIKLTVSAMEGADHILHLQLPGYQSGVLVRMFAAENIMLSAGSACESETPEPSRILTSIGCSRDDAYSGLRLSFAAENTLQEAAVFCTVLDKILKNY